MSIYNVFVLVHRRFPLFPYSALIKFMAATISAYIFALIFEGSGEATADAIMLFSFAGEAFGATTVAAASVAAGDLAFRAKHMQETTEGA
jgi:hypothetical protein